ncbi:MAG: tRNA (adenosine(37)-N6)-threonylcarbamoyltransferase complex dimerization subunit type 1 TsaB [Rhodospirillaceae bacterium]|jgi:tRNA threonylcarbamoyladenosine biosynthesis protein TsaB
MMTVHQEFSILGFDTATRGCSVALWRGGAIASAAAKEMERGQSEALMPMIEGVLHKADKTFADLDALSVTIGPGAFTGLRIGLAAARGMALASGLPVFGITTLEAVAYGVGEMARKGRSILIALDSKRADHYVQVFSEDLIAQTEPQALLPEQLAQIVPAGPVLIAGDAADSAANALKQEGIEFDLSDASGLPDAKIIAARAAARWYSGERPDTMPLPLYLRAPDVSRPR